MTDTDKAEQLNEVKDGIAGVRGEVHAQLASYLAGMMSAVEVLGAFSVAAEMERGDTEAVKRLVDLVRSSAKAVSTIARILDEKFPGLWKDCETMKKRFPSVMGKRP